MKKSFLKGMLAIMALFMCHVAVAQEQPVRKPVFGDGYKAAASQKMAKADEGEWKSMGKGLYRDDFICKLYVVDNYEFEVEVEENTKTPGLYRLVKPYSNYPGAMLDPEITDEYMVIDATNPEQVFFTRYETGMDFGGGGIAINSIAGDMYDQNKFQQAIDEGMCGTLKDKVITFPKNSLLISEAMYGPTTYRFANENGLFRLKLPGAPDLDVKSTLAGKVEKDGGVFVAVNYILGKDVEKMRVAMFEGPYDESMTYNVISGAAPSQEVTQSGSVFFPYEKDGIYTFVSVVYYNGEVKGQAYFTDELSYLQVEWKDLGEAMYSEGFICDNEVDMNVQEATTAVKIQEKTDKPGLYRLVDPYGKGYAYYTPQTYDNTRRYYMEIDASDPNRVVIKKMEDGCGLVFSDLYGPMRLWCNAERFPTLPDNLRPSQDVIDQQYGTLANGEITFPIDALCINYSKVPYREDTWYFANEHGKFKVVLPEGATGIDSAVTGDNANKPVEYFTLEGMKVSKNALKPGIYVKKQGTMTKKIIIK